MKEGIVRAPFTDEQVAAINRYQKSYGVHPFTCECGRDLIATNKGMVCDSCDYTQDWVHDFMAEWKGGFFPLFCELKRDGISLKERGCNIKAVFYPLDDGGCEVFFLVENKGGQDLPTGRALLSKEGKLVESHNYECEERDLKYDWFK